MHAVFGVFVLVGKETDMGLQCVYVCCDLEGRYKI